MAKKESQAVSAAKQHIEKFLPGYLKDQQNELLKVQFLRTKAVKEYEAEKSRQNRQGQVNQEDQARLDSLHQYYLKLDREFKKLALWLENFGQANDELAQDDYNVPVSFQQEKEQEIFPYEEKFADEGKRQITEFERQIDENLAEIEFIYGELAGYFYEEALNRSYDDMRLFCNLPDEGEQNILNQMAIEAHEEGYQDAVYVATLVEEVDLEAQLSAVLTCAKEGYVFGFAQALKAESYMFMGNIDNLIENYLIAYQQGFEAGFGQYKK